MNVIFIFVDGLGIGLNNPSFNPCCSSKHLIFHPENKNILGGQIYRLDSCLGVQGLPQSATGQTTIYTGKNASQLIGKHLFGFPNKQLKSLIAKYSIFCELKISGFSCRFVNAFRPVFFTTPEIFSNINLSATSEMNKSAGLAFSSLKDIRKEKALYHDYTNSELIDKGFDVPKFDAKRAANILLNLSDKYDFILYEYFLTDFAGHKKNMEYAIYRLNEIESLIYHVLIESRKLNKIVIVCSDHGNIEDLRTKSHTYNPAFCALWGNNNVSNIYSLTDVRGLISDIVKQNKVE